MSSTLLALYLGGTLVGRCDVNCFNGDDTRCECLCSGINHGVGLDAAVANTRAMVDEWIVGNRERGVVFDGVEFGIAVQHDALFALPLPVELGGREEVEALAS